MGHGMRKTNGSVAERLQPARSSAPVGLESLLVAGLSERLAEPLFERLVQLFEPLLEARDKPALLAKKDLARELGCCPETVDKLRRQGCPEVTVGDSPRFELDAVLGWLRARAEAARTKGDGQA